MGISAPVANIQPGNIDFFAGAIAPVGWFKANGAAVSRSTYALLFALIGTGYGAGDGATTFNIPDLRGEFLRGLDDGRGIDAGRLLGAWQNESFAGHVHTVGPNASSVDGTPGFIAMNSVGGVGSMNTGSVGGTETRPRNVALLACIKY